MQRLKSLALTADKLSKSKTAIVFQSKTEDFQATNIKYILKLVCTKTVTWGISCGSL